MRFLKRHPFWCCLLLLPIVAILGISCGKTLINPFNPDNYNGLNAVLLKLRLLRFVTALIVGGALAAAGAAYQAVLRNPLAEPFILGISGGASLGAALAIVSGLCLFSLLAVPLAAFVGALAVLAVVLLLARGAGAEYANNVMLSGVIAGCVCSSLLMYLISICNADSINSITWWMLGNLQTTDSGMLLTIAVIIVIGGIVLFCHSREADVLTLGEEMAFHLGFHPLRAALILLLTASLMTAATVALAGILGFVGLIVPHILRKLFGADHRRLFPLCLLGGGIFLSLCDTLAQLYPGAQEFPVGIVTALSGGPFFLWLLNRKRQEGRL